MLIMHLRLLRHLFCYSLYKDDDVSQWGFFLPSPNPHRRHIKRLLRGGVGRALPASHHSLLVCRSGVLGSALAVVSAVECSCCLRAPRLSERYRLSGE